MGTRAPSQMPLSLAAPLDMPHSHVNVQSLFYTIYLLDFNRLCIRKDPGVPYLTTVHCKVL